MPQLTNRRAQGCNHSKAGLQYHAEQYPGSCPVNRNVVTGTLCHNLDSIFCLDMQDHVSPVLLAVTNERLQATRLQLRAIKT